MKRETWSARARRYRLGWSVVVDHVVREGGKLVSSNQMSIIGGLSRDECRAQLAQVRKDPKAWWARERDRRASEAASRLGVGQGSVEVCKARRRRLDALPYSEDPEVQAFVAAHPDGATLVEVGDFFGLTRERIRQLEAEALQSLAIALGRIGVREAPTSDITSWCEGGSTWRTV